MRRLVVFLQLAALTSALTTNSPFGQMDFWGMATTQPSAFPMYQTMTPAPKTANPNQDQAMLEEIVRTAMKNEQRAKNQNTQTKQQSNMNPLLAPWFPVGADTNPSSSKPLTPVMNSDAQMNMMKLQRVMMNNQQPNGNVGPQSGLGSMYQAFLQQMQQTTPAPTTTTQSPTPSPTISAYTPPPSQYSARDGRTPSPTKTLAEIILERINQINESQKNVKPMKSKGCYFKNHWYAPLSEITKGQTGDWCYGTYCNHEGVVVHWDDHKCTHSIPTTPSYTAPPTTPSTAGSGLGCFYNGRWFEPGQDIMNNRNMNNCYGSYCDYNSKIVHWEDKCYATVAPPNMGGMGGMGGSGGMDNMMAMAALAGIDGFSGLAGGNGMSGRGMYGMGGMGGMGGQPGGVAAAQLDLLKR